MTGAQSGGLAVNVVELNPHAPRPFVFTEIALCLRDAIRAAGFASEHWVNEAHPAALCIVLGAVPPRSTLVDLLDGRKIAVYNFEQLGSDSTLAVREYRTWLRDRLVADYHSRNIEFLRRENGPAQRAFELPVVPSASLEFGGEQAAKSVDVLFFGTLSPRREAVLQRLRSAGVTVETVAGAYGSELTPAILRARIVLHVHFYETGLFPVARVLQPVVRGVPVVCESSVFSERGDWSDSGIRFAGYDGLVEACKSLLASPAEQVKRAQRARHFAAQIDFATPFTDLVRSMLRGLVERPSAAAPPSGTVPDSNVGLSNEEIEAVLLAESQTLPPESHLPAPRLALAERELGSGDGLGRWALWLVIAFSLFGLWQTLR